MTLWKALLRWARYYKKFGEPRYVKKIEGSKQWRVCESDVVVTEKELAEKAAIVLIRASLKNSGYTLFNLAQICALEI